MITSVSAANKTSRRRQDGAPDVAVCPMMIILPPSVSLSAISGAKVSSQSGVPFAQGLMVDAIIVLTEAAH